MLEIIEREQLNQRAQEQGEQVVAFLHQLAEQFDCIGDVRHVGAMIAMELVEEGDAQRPAKALTQALVQEAGRQGLILLPAACAPT